MNEKINEKIDVVTIYKKSPKWVYPYKIRWNGRVYFIKKVGYHHKIKEGRTILHIFSVSSDSLAFRLCFNSDTLSWTLQEVEDGSSYQSQ